MSRNYTVPHAAPKDQGGQKFIALMDVQTSQLDFALLKGIGASAFGSASQSAGHLAIGTHTQASKIESLHPVVAIGGVYTGYSATQASPVSSGMAKIANVSNWGELFTTTQPKTSHILSAGSTETIKTTSGIVYEFGAAWYDQNTGGRFVLKNAGVDIRTIVFSATSGTVWATLPQGGIPFSASITLHRDVSGGGGASLMVSYL